jgi:hypothetical protein
MTLLLGNPSLSLREDADHFYASQKNTQTQLHSLLSFVLYSLAIRKPTHLHTFKDFYDMIFIPPPSSIILDLSHKKTLRHKNIFSNLDFVLARDILRLFFRVRMRYCLLILKKFRNMDTFRNFNTVFFMDDMFHLDSSSIM